jgi:carbon-monoxide dehydrogenase large subunit
MHAAEWIGRPVRRREDYRLLTGSGQFVDDVPLRDPLHVVFVRSPHAHARIRSISTSAAAECEGVVKIVTGADVALLGPLGGHLWAAIPPAIENWLQPTIRYDNQLLLAVDRVRFAGEPVAALATTGADNLGESPLTETVHVCPRSVPGRR